MKLSVEHNSHSSLKALIAAQVCRSEGLQISFAKVQRDRGVSCSALPSLPTLELEDGCTLFSANTICNYLMLKGFPSLDHLEIDTWLEWEHSYLEPLVYRVLVDSYKGTPVDGAVLEGFTKCMQKLDEAVKENKFLYCDLLSSVDIAIWCCIYPLAADTKIFSQYGYQYKNVKNWFDLLLKEEAFTQAVGLCFKDLASDILKKSILSIPSPPLPQEVVSQLNCTEAKKVNKITLERQYSETTEDEDSKYTAQEIISAYQSWLHGRQNAPPPREIIHPLLPQEGVKNILINSALPYVNNVPHLGNIIGCVLSADTFARYCRLRNYNTLYICGTDEYGTATETKAIEEGITPREICDKYNKLHTEIYEWFQISFDYFGRTTTQQQTQIAQDIFWRLHKHGFLLEDSTSQLFCTNCDRFLADRFVEGTCPLCAYEDARGDQCDSCGKLINAIDLKSPRCKLCHSTPVVKSSKHLFLNLPELEPKLKSWFEKSSEVGLWTSNAKMIAHSWLKDGLKPRCITRDLKWGTPVPLEGFTDKVFYVWFDAPIGYLSITANYTDEWEKWWKNPSQVQLYQFMAKDNVPFHSIIFPSTEIGADDSYTIVNHLIATEYLNYEDGKFSKSRGVGVFGDEAKNIGIPADIWRFYLLYTRPESQDSAFCWSDLMLKNNSELLNNLGNFINRALAFLVNNFGSVIPEMKLNDDDKLFLAYISRQLNSYLDLLEKVKLRDSIRHILNISRRGNQLIQNNQPWVLVKGSAEEKSRAGSVIGLCANVSCLLSVMIQPFMPNVSKTIQEQLVAPDECNVLLTRFVCYLPTGHKIGKPAPLFQKLENQLIVELKKKFAGKAASRETTPPTPLERKITNSAVPKLIQTENLTAEELKAAIETQGNTVRELKSAKADKKKIDEEVAKLLNIKLQLAIAIGDSAMVADLSKKLKMK